MWVTAAYASYVFLGTAAPGEPIYRTPPETWTWILNDSINFFYVNIFAKFVGLPSIPTPDVNIPHPPPPSVSAPITQPLQRQGGTVLGVPYLWQVRQSEPVGICRAKNKLQGSASHVCVSAPRPDICRPAFTSSQ